MGKETRSKLETSKSTHRNHGITVYGDQYLYYWNMVEDAITDYPSKLDIWRSTNKTMSILMQLPRDERRKVMDEEELEDYRNTRVDKLLLKARESALKFIKQYKG